MLLLSIIRKQLPSDEEGARGGVIILGNGTKEKRKVQMMVCAAAILTLAWTKPAAAETTRREDIRSQWIDMNKGPGVARWVDENGFVSEETGRKTEGNLPPGYMGESEQQGADSIKDYGAWEADEGQNGAIETEQEGIVPSADETAAGQETVPEGAVDSQTATGRMIDPNRPMVALTFDDGPYAPVGNQIMDCAAQYGAKVTFYVVGSRCASYQAEMQRMAAEGHEIGNHTYEHKYLNKLEAQEIQYQVNKGSEAILAASGTAPATVRLPGGNKNAMVLANVNAPVIMWSIDTLDWKTRDTKSTVDKVLGSVQDGDIVLMHELYVQTGEAALQIIPALVERGYQLVTVSEMAQYRGGLENGTIYSAFRP